jgi:hypothetical protein
MGCMGYLMSQSLVEGRGIQLKYIDHVITKIMRKSCLTLTNRARLFYSGGLDGAVMAVCDGTTVTATVHVVSMVWRTSIAMETGDCESYNNSTCQLLAFCSLPKLVLYGAFIYTPYKTVEWTATQR